MGHGAFMGTGTRSHPDEAFDPLADAGNAEAEGSAVFNERDQLVEFRSGMRASEGDADGVEQFLALDAGCGFDLVHPGFESIGRNVACMSADASSQFAQYSSGGVGRQNRGVFLVRAGSFRIETEHRSSFGGELVEVIDCRNKKGE